MSTSLQRKSAAFYHPFLLIRENRSDVFFALSRDEPRAVTFMPVAGRVQVGGDFAFEAQIGIAGRAPPPLPHPRKNSATNLLSLGSGLAEPNIRASPIA